jgi:hypothetical protein
MSGSVSTLEVESRAFALGQTFLGRATLGASASSLVTRIPIGQLTLAFPKSTDSPSLRSSMLSLNRAGNQSFLIVSRQTSFLMVGAGPRIRHDSTDHEIKQMRTISTGLRLVAYFGRSGSVGCRKLLGCSISELQPVMIPNRTGAEL